MQAPASIALMNGAPAPVSKTFTLYYPASGDGGIAEYALEEGSTRDQFPRLTMSARKRANGRVSNTKLSLPLVITNATAGTVEIIPDGVIVKVEVVAQARVPQSLCDDAKAFVASLLGTASVKELFTKQLPLT